MAVQTPLVVPFKVRAICGRSFGIFAACAVRMMFNTVAIGSEKIGPYGPLIVCCTHSNMSLDSGVLYLIVPRNRVCSFWVKAPLFNNSFTGAFFRIINSVPVVRRRDGNQSPSNSPQKVGSLPNPDTSSSPSSEDANSSLWVATMDMLKSHGTICAFPEGTSYTLPHMLALREGVAKATLQYMSLLKEGKAKGQLSIAPIGIYYFHKSKYRGLAIATVGDSIQVDSNILDMSPFEFTEKITEKMGSVTINAHDWDILRAAEMSLMLMIPFSELDMNEYVPLLQSLIDIFTGLKNEERVGLLKKRCSTYRALLRSCNTRDASIIAYTLGRQILEVKRIILGLFVCAPLMAPAFLVYLPFFAIALPLYFREPYKESKSQMLASFGVMFCPLLVIFYLLTVPSIFGISLFRTLGILMLVPLLAHHCSDYVVDAWLTLKASYGLMIQSPKDRQLLAGARADAYAALTALFVNQAGIKEPLENGKATSAAVGAENLERAKSTTYKKDGFSWMTPEFYDSLPKGPFTVEKSVPPGFDFPEPRHIEMKIPTYTRVQDALARLAEKFKQVAELELLDASGLPVPANSRVAAPNWHFARDASGKKIFIHDFMED